MSEEKLRNIAKKYIDVFAQCNNLLQNLVEESDDRAISGDKSDDKSNDKSNDNANNGFGETPRDKTGEYSNEIIPDQSPDQCTAEMEAFINSLDEDARIEFAKRIRKICAFSIDNIRYRTVKFAKTSIELFNEVGCENPRIITSVSEATNIMLLGGLGNPLKRFVKFFCDERIKFILISSDNNSYVSLKNARGKELYRIWNVGYLESIVDEMIEFSDIRSKVYDLMSTDLKSVIIYDSTVVLIFNEVNPIPITSKPLSEYLLHSREIRPFARQGYLAKLYTGKNNIKYYVNYGEKTDVFNSDLRKLDPIGDIDADFWIQASNKRAIIDPDGRKKISRVCGMLLGSSDYNRISASYIPGYGIYICRYDYLAMKISEGKITSAILEYVLSDHYPLTNYNGKLSSKGEKFPLTISDDYKSEIMELFTPEFCDKIFH